MNQNHYHSGSLPYISVVIPVLNAAGPLQKCLEALRSQSYPPQCYEIIVVDNGSRDRTPQIAGAYADACLVEDRVKSPYAARNRGIRYASGQIIAMTDSDCTPAADWLENGVRSLMSGQADLLGGRVEFTFSPRKTIAEMLDSIMNLEMKNNIRSKGVAKTGNLMAYKHVFDQIGLFAESLRSAGDIIWTRRATQAGFKLIYAPDVVISKPARKLRPLLKKQYRVGRGKPEFWRDAGESTAKIIGRTVFAFRPPLPNRLWSAIDERGTPDMKPKLPVIWLTAWLCVIVSGFGHTSSVLGWVFHPSNRDLHESLTDPLEQHRE